MMWPIVRFVAQALSYYATHPSFDGFPPVLVLLPYWQTHPCGHGLWLVGVDYEEDAS